MSIIKNKPFKRVLICLVALFIFCSCGQIKYIPMQTEEKVIVRDSIIKVIDTVTLEVPTEAVKEVLPAIDTSILETSVAKSVAFLDTTKRKIHHTLEQKGQLKVEIDTCYITKVEERIVYKDRPIEVEVIKYKRDVLFWYLLIFQIAVILYLGLRFYFRLK